MSAPPSAAESPVKPEPVTVRVPPASFWIAPPKGAADVLSAFWNATPSMTTKAELLIAMIGPLHAEVEHGLELLPPLPSRVGLATPFAGSMVSGADSEVPPVLTVQFPT